MAGTLPRKIGQIDPSECSRRAGEGKIFTRSAKSRRWRARVLLKCFIFNGLVVPARRIGPHWRRADGDAVDLDAPIGDRGLMCPKPTDRRKFGIGSEVQPEIFRGEPRDHPPLASILDRMRWTDAVRAPAPAVGHKRDRYPGPVEKQPGQQHELPRSSLAQRTHRPSRSGSDGSGAYRYRKSPVCRKAAVVVLQPSADCLKER